MAIAAPATVVAEYGQDLSVTVTLITPTNVAGWTATATLRAYNGGPALATKTTASATEIVVTDTANGVFVVYFSAADLTREPGAYVFEMDRTNAGFVFPIVDPSAFIIRPSGGSAYPTLTNLSEYVDAALGGVTPTDPQIRQYLELLYAAEDWVKRYCNRDFTYKASSTEYYDGHGTFDLQLARYPFLPADVTVYEDYGGNYGQTTGSFDATTSLLTQGTDYAVPVTPTWGDGKNHTGIIKRLGVRWPYRQVRAFNTLGYYRDTLPGCVKVTYTAGYQLIPYPVKKAVWGLTTILAQSAENGRLIMSESGEGESVSYGPVDDIPWTIRRLLDPFKRVVI